MPVVEFPCDPAGTLVSSSRAIRYPGRRPDDNEATRQTKI